MSPRRSHIGPALLAAALAAGCKGPPRLRLTPPQLPFAVGRDWIGDNAATIEAFFSTIEETCWRAGPVACGKKDERSAATILDAQVDDPAIFALPAPPSLAVRPRAAGTANLVVRAREPGGAEDTASVSLDARVPDALRVYIACAGERVPRSPVAVPASSRIAASVTVLAGEAPLRTGGLPPINWGALGVVDPDAAFPAPATPTTTHITSPAFPNFDLAVRVYEQREIDGIVLRPRTPGPYGALNGAFVPFEVDVALTVGGEPACLEDLATLTRTVHVETPEICELAPPGLPDKQTLRDPPRVTVMGRQGGTCVLSAVSDVTGHTARLEIPITLR